MAPRNATEWERVTTSVPPIAFFGTIAFFHGNSERSLFYLVAMLAFWVHVYLTTCKVTTFSLSFRLFTTTFAGFALLVDSSVHGFNLFTLLLLMDMHTLRVMWDLNNADA
jgi:hypothetical protein